MTGLDQTRLVCFLVTTLMVTFAGSATAQHETHRGEGDDVVRITKPDPDLPALLVVQGNPTRSHFAITAHTASRERVDLLVNTTSSYSGIVPVDLPPRQTTALLEVAAEGSWSIEVYPIGAAQQIDAPGSFNGSGDNVLWVDGSPATAQITSNAGDSHFAVIAYDGRGNRQDLLVNTTSGYEGTVLLPDGVRLLQITAEGGWTVRLE